MDEEATNILYLLLTTSTRAPIHYKSVKWVNYLNRFKTAFILFRKGRRQRGNFFPAGLKGHCSPQFLGAGKYPLIPRSRRLCLMVFRVWILWSKYLGWFITIYILNKYYKKGVINGLILLDFSKTFDLVDHGRLLKKIVISLVISLW